jgi:hypothetical protein
MSYIRQFRKLLKKLREKESSKYFPLEGERSLCAISAEITFRFSAGLRQSQNVASIHRVFSGGLSCVEISGPKLENYVGPSPKFA